VHSWVLAYLCRINRSHTRKSESNWEHCNWSKSSGGSSIDGPTGRMSCCWKPFNNLLMSCTRTVMIAGLCRRERGKSKHINGRHWNNNSIDALPQIYGPDYFPGRQFLTQIRLKITRRSAVINNIRLNKLLIGRFCAA